MTSLNHEEHTMPHSRAQSLMPLRTARWMAATVLLAGGMLAALSGANAWADRGHGGKGGPEACMHQAGHPGGMLGGGRMMNRMLDDIKATDAQRAQIRSIQDAARADLKKLHDQHASFHQDLQKLLAAPVVDAAAVEKHRQQMLAHHDAVSKRMTSAMVDTSNVLTPEQRSAMATHWQERAKARADRHERHERRQHHHHDAPKG